MGQMIFVMGPAGSGKTTLCRAIKSYGTSIGRNFIYVNMDPFQQTDLNEMADISVSDYIRTEDIMESIDIGPNSALLRSMSEIAANIDELHIDTDEYYILDFPGQLELFSHCLSLIEIVEYCKKFHQCVAFYLMDAGCFKDDGKFLCGSLMCLMCVLRIAVPYYLIRSKADQGCVCRAEEHDLRGRNRELKDLNKDNHDLESSNHDLNKDDHDLESGNYDLNKDNHDLESGNHDLESGNHDLESGNHDLKDVNDDLKSEYKNNHSLKDNKNYNIDQNHHTDSDHECIVNINPEKLNEFDKSLFDFLENNEMLNFIPVNVERDDHLERLLYLADSVTQFYESEDPAELDLFES